MTQIAYDHSGLPVQSRQHDDGYEYNITGTTRLGDEVYSDYGGRWLKCISVVVHIQNNLRYRRPKAMAKFTDEQYAAATALLKSLDFNSADAIQLITLASSFGAALQSVNKEVSNDT